MEESQHTSHFNLITSGNAQQARTCIIPVCKISESAAGTFSLSEKFHYESSFLLLQISDPLVQSLIQASNLARSYKSHYSLYCPFNE